jgi:hypothetical protein
MMDISVYQTEALLEAIEESGITIEQAIIRIKKEKSCWNCANRLFGSKCTVCNEFMDKYEVKR